MANYLTVPLKTGSIRYRHGPRASMRQPIADTEVPLQRIRGEDGTCATLDTKKGRTRVRQKSCFICRRYVGKKINVQWVCVKCVMPLCKINRKQGPNGESCLEERLITSQNHYLGCGFLSTTNNEFIMPDELKLWKQEQHTTTTPKRHDSNTSKRRKRKSTDITPSTEKDDKIAAAAEGSRLSFEESDYYFCIYSYVN
jgi:hypothetical protein